VEDATPVRSVNMPTVTLSAVTPVALAVFPLVEPPPVPDGAAVVAVDAPFELPHAAASNAASSTTATDVNSLRALIVIPPRERKR
jgi:hypothetical protein